MNGAREPVECAIRVGGREIAALYPYVREVTVEMSRQSSTTASIVLDTFRREDGRWLVQDEDVFVPWREVHIDACFGRSRQEVMRGYVRQVKPEYPPDMGGARVTVECQDSLLLLDRSWRRETLSTEDQPARDDVIASRFAQDAGLAADVETGLDHTSLVLDDTPARFLRERARANGFELFVRAGVLHFHPPRLETSAQPPILVGAGAATNCVQLSIDHDGHRPDRVRVARAPERGSDPEEPDVVESELDLLGAKAATSEGMGLEPFEWTLVSPRGATRAEVLRRAAAAAAENAWKISAQGELDGALYGHVLLTHQTVTVDGVGTTYGGAYYVDAVTHRFSHDGYRQQFKLLRNATG